MRSTRVLAAAAAVLGAAVPAAAAPAAGPAAAPLVAPVPAVTHHVAAARFPGITPPTTAECQVVAGVACYSPLQYRVAYDLNPLYAAGVTGTDRTIVIVDAFGSPTVEADLATFDSAFGLPAPPSFRIITPVGAIPPYDDSALRQSWAYETTLDVEYAHAVAPDAKILLVETPVTESEGIAGFPEIVAAENYVVGHGLGDVISQSFGAPEETFPNLATLYALRTAYLAAAVRGVTVLASSGDQGSTGAGPDGSTLYPAPVSLWPSSDPLVTSVGGTRLHLDAAGNRTSPDTVWDDRYGATGGGLSKVFLRPAYQVGVAQVVGTQRGTPDVSMAAGVDGGAMVYTSFSLPSAGWHVVGGTSESSPLFAGIVALADQLAGRRLGLLGPSLYTLGALRSDGLVDVTSGGNGFAGVPGWPAAAGYDLASGWGTVDAAKLVPALAGPLL